MNRNRNRTWTYEWRWGHHESENGKERERPFVRQCGKHFLGEEREYQSHQVPCGKTDESKRGGGYKRPSVDDVRNKLCPAWAEDAYVL